MDNGKPLDNLLFKKKLVLQIYGTVIIWRKDEEDCGGRVEQEPEMHPKGNLLINFVEF